MNKMFYSKLAINNIKKNKNTYFPYILSSTVIISLFYILHAISQQVVGGNFFGVGTMSTILNFGVYTEGIFSIIFIFYTNSFLIKQRKKELGLYSVLGMEKKHISRVLLWEVVYSGGISLLIGILSGVLFGRLMFTVLLNILNLSTSIEFSISIKSIITTMILFISTFGLVMLFNIIRTYMTNPIDLIKGDKKGEREPKTKWLMSIVGFIFLGIGYYLSLTIKNPINSINVFFIAIILVIFATYLLFTAGSITCIKILRKNKKFYYNKKHFISVSSMIYRMKQNAVGLTNICILSTAVLLTLSSTISLYVGMEDIMRTRFPYDVMTNYKYDGEENEEIEKLILNNAENYDVNVNDMVNYKRFSTVVYLDENRFTIDEMKFNNKSMEDMYEANLFTLEDYNKYEGKDTVLNKDEILIYTNTGDFDYNSLNIYDKKLKIKDQVEDINFVSGMNIFNTINIIVPDEKVLNELATIISEKEGIENHVYYEYNFNLDGKKDNKIEFVTELNSNLKESIENFESIEDIYTNRDDFLSVYGSLFFIGLFLGTMFMVATVLIIYYKQISEGYEDHDRFVVMQKVGMSKDEVKSTIKSQVLMVFFLPLVTAIIHLMVAFPAVTKILALLNLTNKKLFLGFTGLIILVFVLVYGIVYSWTSRIYYKLVK
ncbi:ABC transporter permease [Clostridium sp. D2Q-14]|uniref:ABC transporter permease n=1 Tax=Anaeromonas gelatinilytica TaxID=2683194 RepID=UPI00193BE170|nr:ABC transporter permease [Anaeromonas gelatinilytica]MBS4534760.1 ABC transporter permease [Anaeromonas gelatinilytica]